MKSIVVLYHKDCSDGFGAAWAARRKFGNRADYIPLEYNMPMPGGLNNKEIYFVDFSYPIKILRKLTADNKRVVIIDHHLSAEHDIKKMSDYYFDLKHSGSVLAWKYFHPGKSVPWLLRYVEDRDLWNYKLPALDCIGAVLDLTPFNFKKWNRLAKDFEKPKIRKEYVNKGKILVDYERSKLEELEREAIPIKLKGHKILSVNSPLLHSKIGHILAKKQPPFAVVWHQMSPEKIKVSLRSEGRFDVSKIAKFFGGGGHKAAAAFLFPVSKKFPWKILKE